MPALTVLIIRHAEKPHEAFPGPGLTLDGKHNDKSLVIRGWQRAGAWAALFGAPRDPDYPVPDLIYAADPDEPPGPDTPVSKRPWETVLPLCEKLSRPPIATHGVGDEEALVHDVTQRTGTVLISWEHKKIVEAILPLLAAGQPIPDLPTHWKSERFDVVLRFDRPGAGAPWHFRQLFPLLLSGDSDKPLKD